MSVSVQLKRCSRAIMRKLHARTHSMLWYDQPFSDARARHWRVLSEVEAQVVRDLGLMRGITPVVDLLELP